MKELVLTGHDVLWPKDDKSAVYLGPWCFAYNHKYAFSDQASFRVVESPWKSKEDLLCAAQYIDDLADRLTPSVAKALNEAHQTDYPGKFWKTYLVAWMTHWLGACFDRYKRLSIIRNDGGCQYRVSLLNIHSDIRLMDIFSFFDAIEHHDYNLLLFSQIITNGNYPNITVERYIDHVPNLRNGNLNAGLNSRSLLDRFRQAKTLVVRKIRNLWETDVVLGNIPGLSLVDRWLMQLMSSARFPRLIFHKDTTPSVNIKSKMRGMSLTTFNPLDEFEHIIQKILLDHIPQDYLVTHPPSKHETQQTTWIGNDIYLSGYLACKIARICSNNGKWLSAQHGGGYGHLYSFPIGAIEYKASNGFITWGWKYKHNYDSNYYPLPSPLLSKLPRHKQRNNVLIIISTLFPAYHYRFHSVPQPEHLLPYMQSTINFISNLDEAIRTNVLSRPYVKSYGIHHDKFQLAVLPLDQISGKGAITDNLKKCRLAVFDHMATTFMESLVMNTPTILFWSRDHFAVTPAAEPYFERLREAGILFNDPEAAAKKVNAIWDDVSAWWNQESVQTAKNEFCRQYAKTSRTWRREWIDFIKTLRTCKKPH